MGKNDREKEGPKVTHLEYVGRKSARVADDEQSLRVTNRVVCVRKRGGEKREGGRREKTIEEGG